MCKDKSILPSVLYTKQDENARESAKADLKKKEELTEEELEERAEDTEEF